jgi:hypothetical protein
MKDISPFSIVGAIIAVLCITLAGLVLIAPGDNDRVALFLGVVGIALPALIGQLKADQAAGNTNGKLDARIQSAVHRANAARRRGDEPKTPEEINGQ